MQAYGDWGALPGMGFRAVPCGVSWLPGAESAFQAETPELQSKQPSRPEDFFAVLAELSRVVLVLSRLQPRFCSVTFRRNGRVSVVLLCSISWAELLLSIAIESRVCVCVCVCGKTATTRGAGLPSQNDAQELGTVPLDSSLAERHELFVNNHHKSRL